MAGVAVAVPVVKLTFFEKVKAELKKLFSHVPRWQASAAATLTYVAPLVETIIALVDPAVAPAVDALIAKVQSAMAAAAVVIKDAGPTPTLVTYLTAINADLTEVETAAGIKDPASAAKLTALIGTISGEVAAILSEVGASAAA